MDLKGSSLSARIKEKISEKNLSVQALEKKAGLKPSAIQNIIYGRSKHPSITLIQTIARVLECRIEELLDDEGSKAPEGSGGSTRSSKTWDQELYLKCFDIIHRVLKEEGIRIEKGKILDLVDETYEYSRGNANTEAPDKYFAQWLVRRHREE